MPTFLRIILSVLSLSFVAGVFAAEDTVMPEVPSDSTLVVVGTASGAEDNASGAVESSDAVKKHEEEEKKDREKTINDINTFLIESYKIKIDKILANLNMSLERVTNNDPAAQAKLLEKIRGDISTKLQIINSRNVSENRKKILSSVFSYIQENLDAKISKLVQQK